MKGMKKWKKNEGQMEGGVGEEEREVDCVSM